MARAERVRTILTNIFPHLLNETDVDEADDLLSYLSTEVWNSDVLQQSPDLTKTDEMTSKQRRSVTEKQASRLALAIGNHLVSLGCSQSDAESLTICENIVTAWCDIEDEPLKENVIDVDEVDEDDDVPPGHCAMCLRYMPLTFHHLVPKMVQKSMLKKGVCTRETVNLGIDICRPCHSAIHSRFDHETLATRMNSLEKLMEDESLQRWVRFAEKQRVVSKDHAIRGLRYRR